MTSPFTSVPQFNTPIESIITSEPLRFGSNILVSDPCYDENRPDIQAYVEDCVPGLWSARLFRLIVDADNEDYPNYAENGFIEMWAHGSTPDYTGLTVHESPAYIDSARLGFFSPGAFRALKNLKRENNAVYCDLANPFIKQRVPLSPADKELLRRYIAHPHHQRTAKGRIKNRRFVEFLEFLEDNNFDILDGDMPSYYKMYNIRRVPGKPENFERKFNLYHQYESLIREKFGHNAPYEAAEILRRGYWTYYANSIATPFNQAFVVRAGFGDGGSPVFLHRNEQGHVDGIMAHFAADWLPLGSEVTGVVEG